ncbi:MAG: hypothetical protein KKF76_09495, partial [Gammaproteobacteria bacterium]|nr:hypothetical protein [Gammaproteobacteria bacterium]
MFSKVKELFGKDPNPTATKPTESKFRMASALAIGIADHTAEAIIGSDDTAPTLSLSGDLSVQALQRQSALHNSADSTVNADVEMNDGTKVALSVAAVYSQLQQQTRALIGDGANITASRIGLGAQNQQQLDLNGLDRWSSLDQVFDNLKTLTVTMPEVPGMLSTSYANSTGEADKLSMTGTISVLLNDQDATAWVGDNVTLNATSTSSEPWTRNPLASLDVLMDGAEEDEARKDLRDMAWEWDAPLSVQAANEFEQLAITGNLWWSLFNNTSDGGAVGAGVNVQITDNEAIAGIGANGSVTAKRLNVNAKQNELIVGISPSAGKGATVAASGAVVVSVVDSTVHASVHNSTAVTADQVSVTADHGIGVWTAAGALAASENAGIGASVAVNVLTTDVLALVGDNSAWRPVEQLGAGGTGLTKAQWRVDEVLVNAESTGQVGAFSVAGAVARTAEEQQKQDEANASEGGADSGSSSLAGSLGEAITQTLTNGVDLIGSGLTSVKDQAVEVKDTIVEIPDKLKGYWDKLKGMLSGGGGDDSGQQEPGSKVSLAIAGSLSLNVSGQKTRAHLGDIVLDPRDPLKGSKVTVLSLNQTNQLSGSGSGALTLAGGKKSNFSSAIAGAIAYNHLFNVTEALLDDAKLNANDLLKVQAASGGDQIAMGLGLAVSTGGETNVGVAVSASGAVVGNTTRAAVENSEITQREASVDGISVTAYDRSRLLIGGGAFAGTSGKGAAAGGSVVVGVVTNKVKAEWLGSQATGFDRLDVSANSASRVLAGAIAGAIAAGSEGGAGAGSILAVVVKNDVGARVDAGTGASSLTGGAVNVNAQSVSGAQAMDSLFDNAAQTALSNAGLDLDGKTTTGQIDGKVETNDNLFDEGGDAGTTSSHNLFTGELAGEAVLGVAGSLAATGGKAGVGGAFSVIYTGSDYSATVANTAIDLTGDLKVAASNNTDVLAAAISAAGGSNVGVSGSGTAVIARGTVTASVDMTGRTLKADDLSVTAVKSGGAYSLAGNITGSANNASVGGAFSLSDMQQTTSATVANGSYRLGGDATIKAGQESRIITAALSGSVSGSGVAVGGALTYNRVADTTNALLSNANLQADDLTVSASQPNLGASIWSLAFNLAAAGGAAGVGAGVAVNVIDADRSAKITGSTVNLTGNATLASALDGQIWGVGVDAGGGAQAGVGGSIVINVIDGEDKVSVEDSTLTTSGTGKALLLDASGGTGLMIASLTGSIKGSGTAAVGGAISVNRIGANRIALAKNSTVSGFSSASLLSGAKQDIYAIAIAGGGAGNVAVNGSSTSNVLQGEERATIDGGSFQVGSLTLSAAEGDRTIWSLAGAISGAGTVAVGVANANNIILSKRVAETLNTSLTLTGALKLESGGSAHIRSAAVGGGGAGNAAAGASIAINVIEGEESALIRGSTITGASSVTVEVVRGDADIKTLAGNVQGAGNGAGAGAVAISTVNQARQARILDSQLSIGSAAARVEAATRATITTLALSGAGAGNAAVVFSNTSNNIAARTLASVENSGGAAGNLSVLAADTSSIYSGAGGVAGAANAAVGGATAINRVDSQIEARLLDTKNTGWALNNLRVDAHSAADIISAAVAGGGSANATVMAVAATNIIQTQALAHVGSGAQVVAQNNVGISARNVDSILGTAAVVAGSGNAAVSGIGTVNVVETRTRAYIDGATTAVSALAKNAADTLLIDSGNLVNAPGSDHQWISGDQFNPRPDLAIAQHSVTGLAVQASSVQQVGQLAISASIAVIPLYSGAVSGVLNTTVLAGDTLGYIDAARINGASGAGTGQNVRVGADSYSYTAGYLAAIAGGPSAAAVSGALDSTVITRTTRAYLRGTTLNSRGATRVEAGSQAYGSTLVASFSGAIVGVGGTSSVLVLKGETEALVDGGSSLQVGSLAVDASASQHLSPNAATAAAGGVAVGGSLVTLYNQSVTRAWVGTSLDAAAVASGARTSVRGGAVTINASNRTGVLLNVASAGGGPVAVGGSVAISVIETTTEAGASQADFGTAGGKLGSLSVQAFDRLDVLNNAGSIQVGGISVGGTANVLVVNSANRALFDRSTLQTSGAFSLKALREGDIYLNTLTGAAGGMGAVSGSLGLLLLGPGAVSVSAEGQTVNPLDELDKNGNGSLSQSNRDGQADKVKTIGYQDYVLNETTGEYELKDLSDSATASEVNDNSRVSMGDRLSAGAVSKHQTVARVSSSTVQTGGSTTLLAQDKLHSSNLAGNAVIGAGTAVGGAFALTLSNARVAADILGGSLTAASLNVKAEAADLGAGPAVQVYAVSGAGDLIAALGAGIGVAILDNEVSSTLGGTLQTSGNMSVAAEDRQNLDVQALGASFAGTVGAGLVLGVAAHDSAVKVSVLDSARLTAANLSITSLSQSAVTLTGRGAAAGLQGGVNAVILVASDHSSAELKVGNNAELSASENLSLIAEANPYVKTESLGVALGGSLAAGGTVGIALADALASLDIGSQALLQAKNATLASRIGRQSGLDSVTVKGLGVSGGFGVSANAVVATAHNESRSLLQTADSARFVGLSGGDWTFAASTDVRQRTKTEGYAAGLLTLGANISVATAETSTEALISGRFSGDIGDLKVASSATVDNEARSEAGQGGLVSGAASVVRTSDTSTTRAVLYARGATDSVDAVFDTVELSAYHQSRFNGFANSINASLVGASGAHVSNSLNVTTLSELASASRVLTGAYDQSAYTDVVKSSGDYNVQSGSGGVVDAAAVRSATTIALNTQANIGANARLRLDGDWRNPEHLRVQAFNNVYARDKVKLDSGGAISIALAQSLIDVTQAKARVTVGSGADIYSVGDLILSASGFYDIDARVNAKTWGAAGAAQGLSRAQVNADYAVTVGTNANLFSYGDAKFYAGYNVSGQMNKAVLTARTDLWNNTAFPVVTDPEADAIYVRNSNLLLNGGSHVRSVGDIYAYAGKGYSILTGEGIGKDLYREVASAILGAIVGEVSLDITGGSTQNGGSAKVTANGTLDAGVYSQQKLHVSGLKYLLNGVEVDPASLNENTTGTLSIVPVISEISDGITYRVKSGEYSQLISDRIVQLKKQLADYGLSPFEKTAFQAELNLLEQTLARIYTQMGGDAATGTLPGQLQVWMLEVDPILARPGNIFVTGDALVGSGKLNAPGDAKIEVINSSSLFLDIKGLEIPDRDGGQLLFNGAKMLSNANIQAANVAGLGSAGFTVQVAENSPAPQVIVKNTYNPATGFTDAAGLKAPAPDIYINGVIANKRGNVSITASYGSIYANADIRGQSLTISAGQNFVLNNPDAFTHIGGDPAHNNSGGVLTGPRAGSGVVAGNNVVISALYLNINGLVQSGVADWAVTINESAFGSLDSLRTAWRNGGAAVVQLVQTDARTGTIGFSYDFRTESILLDQVDVGGGYMELTGHILSTGNGQLKVLDGYSQVKVVNNTTRQLNIAGIDLGNGVEGTLRINDVGRKGGDGVWSTIYTNVGDQVQRYEGWSNQIQTTGAFYQGASAGSSTSYGTTTGRSYVWLQGRDTTDTTTKVEYWDKFWGFVPTGDGTLLGPPVTVKGASTPIEGAEYMGYIGTDALGAGSVLSQLSERYETGGDVEIGKWMGGYCKTHFIWCQVYRTTRTTVTQQGFKEIDRYTVRADVPISVSFIGYEAGGIDLTSAGNVTLLGSLYNLGGNTNIKVTNGALTQGSDSVVIGANSLTVEARNGLGDLSQALRLQIGNSLSAYSALGNINLQAVNGGVNLARLEAAQGNIALSAQGNITGNAGTVVTGRSIDLRSTHGSIGTSGQWLNLNTGSHSLTSTALFNAEAVGNIYVEETSGNLVIDQVKAGGDIGIKVRSGDLLDGNSEVSYDERSLADLQALWAEMGLTGAQSEAALAQQKQTLVEAGQQSYARYWQLRNLSQAGDGSWQADAFDADQARLGSAQVDQLKSLGWTDAQINAEQVRRVADYQALDAQFGGQAYDSAYTYQLSAEQTAQLDTTASWTEDQLRYSIASSLLNRGSGGSGSTEAMNIEGRNVTLIANRIGKLLADDVSIDLSNGAGSLTTAQRVALASAEQDDVYFDENNPLRFSIVQRDDVNVTATGTLSVTAQGDVFLGGEQDLNIYNVQGDSIRIKTSGSIESANGSNVVINGHDVVLEAAGGSIGAKAGGLNLQATGDLTARANYLNLIQHGDLSVQRLTGLDALHLKVLGNLTSASQLGESLLGGSVNLTVTGNVGSSTDRVQIGTGGVDDRIAVNIGGNAWLGGLQGVASQPGVLRFAGATVGGTLDIGQTYSLTQYGDWELGGLVLDLNNQWTMTSGTTLTTSGGLFAEVDGAATLANVSATGTGADINIRGYSLSVAADGNQWRANDRLALSTYGDIGGASRHATLGAQQLAVASTTGALFLDLLGGIGQGSLVSAGAQMLKTLGNLTLTEVHSTAAGVTLQGTGDVRVDTMAARDDLTLAGDSLALGSASSSHGDLSATLVNRFSADTLNALGDWTLTAASADVGLATIGGNVQQTLTGTLDMTDLVAGGNWSLNGAQSTIGTTDIGGAVSMTQSGLLTLGTLTGDSSWTLNGTSAKVTTATLAGQVNTTLSGDLDLGTLTGQQGWMLDAANATIVRAELT